MPLTDIKVRQAKPTDKLQKLADGGALYLVIKPNGTKLWWYRYKLDGKENTFSIGEYPAVPLQQARQERDAARELVKKGIHPGHYRQLEKIKQLHLNANSFEAIAREYVERRDGQVSPYYLRQMKTGLEKDVYPVIGHFPITDVKAAHLVKIIQGIEDRGAPTVAINTRQWISRVFCYATMTARAEHDPASALRGLVRRPKVEHAKPLTEEEIADFKARLARFRGARQTTIALNLLLLLFCRTIELRRAEWVDVDFEKEQWVIPAEKMKMGRVHVVPLSRQALVLLKELHRITGGGSLVWPSARNPSVMTCATTVNKALEHMGYGTGRVTGHDFRATASTRLHEMGYRPDIIELQLAHVEKSKTKAAYNHAQYLPERRRMMQEWADWIDTL